MPSWRIPGGEAARPTATVPAVLATAVAAVLCAAVLGTAGCTARSSPEAAGNQQIQAHRALVEGYFEAVNAAAARGSAAQEQLFGRAQHPDFRDLRCSLAGLTVTVEPAYGTLHPDPGWRVPLTGESPRGTVYVVAATVLVQHSTAVLASQIGSLHVVVLDGAAYGFAPCPA